MTAHLNAYAAILAGGVGSRFWPASTPQRPKQFLPLAGPTPLLDQTLTRAARLVGSDRVLIVTSRAHAERIEASARPHSGARTLYEPVPRGTGPALAWAAHEIARERPEAVMISMHADHRIEPLDGLRATLEEAVARAEEGWLCCIGVPPDRPEVGYGYVELGDRLSEGGAHEARAFVEKPDAETALRYLEGGRHLWNSGIFVWRCADLLAALEAHAEELADALPALRRDDVDGFFERARPVSIDVAVMERALRVATVEARFEWDDLGVWDALARGRGVDARRNAVVGPARLLDADGNIVWTETVRANVIGVSGLVVVEANGELLVMPRAASPRLNEIVDALEAGGDGDAA